MNYEQLSQEYQDDVLADALYAREVEWFHYNFDRVNFEHLLLSLPPGEYRSGIERKLSSTIVQMNAVELIYAALKSQITDVVAHSAAVSRVSAKREAVKAQGV